MLFEIGLSGRTAEKAISSGGFGANDGTKIDLTEWETTMDTDTRELVAQMLEQHAEYGS